MQKIKLIKTNKGYYGFEVINGQKYFIKQGPYVNNEIKGYFLCDNLYNRPKIINFDNIKQKLIYEYNSELDKNILHKSLYYKNSDSIDFSKLIDTLTSPLKDPIKLPKLLLQNERFFSGRVNYFEDYKNKLNLLETNLVYNKEHLPKFSLLLDDIIHVLKDPFHLYSCITQGDPTDVNVTLNGIITDFEVGGQNSICGEIAIFLGCYLFNNYYFYPKYMKSAHAKFKKTYKMFQKEFIPIINFKKNKIHINLITSLPLLNKKLILTYLEKIKNITNKDVLQEIDKYIGKYLTIRLLSPVNLLFLEEKDKIILMALSLYIWKNVNSLDRLIEIINKF